MVEMLETSDGEQRFCHRPTSLRAIIFLIHITGCDSGTDMQ